jgi:hypothetical protein
VTLKVLLKRHLPTLRKHFPIMPIISLVIFETVEIDKPGFVKVKEGIIRIERTQMQKILILSLKK